MASATEAVVKVEEVEEVETEVEVLVAKVAAAAPEAAEASEVALAMEAEARCSIHASTHGLETLGSLPMVAWYASTLGSSYNRLRSSRVWPPSAA